MSGTVSFGCVIVATGLARDAARAQLVDDHLDALIALAALLGAAPIVVMHDGTPRVAAPARDVRLSRAERDDLSAYREGLVQLTNAPVGAALFLPIEAHTTSVVRLRALIDEATRRGALIAATATGGTLGFPIFATRDSWRELITTAGGIEEVLRGMGSAVVVVEGE